MLSDNRVFKNFKFVDGNTGQSYDVLEFIDDGNRDFIVDEEERLRIIELLRWSDDGGKHYQSSKHHQHQ